VRTIEEIARDPHLEERGYFVNVEHPVAGVLAHPGSPFRLSVTPGEVGGPAPLLGQHNADVYCGRLGLSQEDLARLRMAGIV
jgi:crotonobetainyl-CoA:carnitine CoA-transferase CaiB-like acyl-CoA transferase